MADCLATGGDHGERPSYYKIIGIVLAVSSGAFIGTSFVLKKKGLLKANVKYSEEAGEGYGYLKNAFWWTGMTLMIVGEICNFVAYAFVDAILVTPLGALSVVICTILSAIFLKERLSFVGKVGCFNCVIGSIIIVLNVPEQSAISTIQQMQCFVISPGFLSYAGIILVACAFVAFWAGPRYGKKSMLVYLSVCSLIGGLSVVATQGLGAAIVSQINGTNTDQFKQWFLYVLLVFVVATLLTEIVYLNKALNIFNAAMVTPTYYVYFTSATIVSSAVLFRGFKGGPITITTVVLGFLQICAGVVLLQLSKSSKDVPDTAVFQGDLDQVRTVAEQEEHESEPKADTIRGTAALLRSFSKTRKQHEVEEAKRVQTDMLEPIGENESVEWDGLRRRKTTLEPGQPPPSRQKTVHPPLGLTRFPDPDDSDNESTSHQFLPSLRSKAQTVFRPHKSSTATQRTLSFGSDGLGSDGTKVQLAQMSSTRLPSGHSDASYADKSAERDIFGDSSNLRPHHAVDTSYKSPASAGVQFVDKPESSGSQHTLSPDPRQQTKRAFSFQNVFSRPRSTSKSAVTPPPTVEDTQHRPITANSAHSGSSSFFKLPRRRGSTAAGTAGTEEERAGLVEGGGDSMSGRGGHGRSHSGGADLGGMAIREQEYESSDELEDYERDSDTGSIQRSPSLERGRDASSGSEGFERVELADVGGRGGPAAGTGPGAFV
ncbi:MAG: hypothetical protein M1831_001181 [Alyxoria varia]|nr:MAG: hypothetical protein M1831_001181 [Alyxoria varia]